MQSFRVPSHPEDLLNASDDAYLVVQTNTAVASLNAESIQSLADGKFQPLLQRKYVERKFSGLTSRLLGAGVVYDLINNTALCIIQQQQFDSVYCLIRCAATTATPAAWLTQIYLHRRIHLQS